MERYQRGLELLVGGFRWGRGSLAYSHHYDDYDDYAVLSPSSSAQKSKIAKQMLQSMGSCARSTLKPSARKFL